jgi:Rha family phage regulatory protein
MNEIPQVQDLVIFDGQQAVTDTLVLAKTFGKRHATVLRAYDNLKLNCAEEFMRRNFTPHESVDERGNVQRSVTMTKDGFSLMVTGYAGPNVMVLMESYLAAFDSTVQHIFNHKRGLWQVYRATLEKGDESEAYDSFGSYLVFRRKMH